MPLACCRRDSLSRRRRGVTVYPGFDAALDVKLQSVWLPRLEEIGGKACSGVSASCQQRSGTLRRVVLHGDKQPRVHDRVICRASVRAGINHVADVIRAVGSASSATLREGDVRGYPWIGSTRVAVVGRARISPLLPSPLRLEQYQSTFVLLLSRSLMTILSPSGKGTMSLASTLDAPFL
jgi:hypothetical protein